MDELVFECKMCGKCCEGKGGIILSAADIARLCGFLRIAEHDLLERFAEFHNGKWRLGVGSDGRCYFFQAGLGCGVHAAKPDICSAWPFFRGNMVDAASLELAKDYCPGIRKDADFSKFQQQGLAYLESLAIAPGSTCANALAIADLLNKS